MDINHNAPSLLHNVTAPEANNEEEKMGGGLIRFTPSVLPMRSIGAVTRRSWM